MNQRYLMSSAQKRIYTIEMLREKSITYNVPMAFEAKTRVDYDRLGKAFRMLCQRHEVLRSHFIVEDEKFIQVVEEKAEAELIRLSGNKEHLSEITQKFVQPFDLSRAPLIRMGLLECADGTSVVFIDVHHIVFDGGSTYTLLSDISDLYKGIELEPLSIQYKDFVAWQNSLVLEEQKEYWLAEHKGRSEYAEIPTDYPRQKHQEVEGAYVDGYLGKEITEKIKVLCHETAVTPVMLYMTGIMGLLAEYSREREVAIGTPAEGRTHPDAQNMIGMFVNTLAIRGTIESEMSFMDSLLYMKEKCLNAYENQDFPFEKLLDNLNMRRGGNRNPLFDIMFSYELEGGLPLYFDGVKSEILPIRTNISKFDLTLTVIEGNNGVVLNWEYNRKLYKESTIRRLNKHFIVFLENAISSPDTAMAEISCINEEEEYTIKYCFNDCVDAEISEIPIKQFEKQAKDHPLRTAALFKESRLSYGELNEKANYIAWRLKDIGIQSNDVVALYVGRSLEMICGIIGIMKAGAAYLPIDLKHPKERVKYIVEDSNAAAILSDQPITEDMTQGKKAVYIDLEKCCQENPDTAIGSFDTAYIIYTSGTTGNPKGVMIAQRNLANLMRWQMQEAAVNETSVVLQKSTYVFDASVWEIFLALLSGAALQLLTEEENSDFSKLLDIVQQNKVTHTLMIPTVFDALLDYMDENERGGALASIRRVYLGAETVTKQLIQKYYQITGKGKETVTNLYGPTECTVCATSYDFVMYDGQSYVPIGKPIGNTEVYILNGGQLCGIGVPGEIYIGGAGIAKGYIHNSQLTEEKFCLVKAIADKTLYRTGDMGKWREDGVIDYLGRMDDQIKIRGFRVEVKEIEARLKEWQDIRNAVVILRDEENKYLCAYITAAQKVDTEALKQYISAKLPDYMVPSFIIQIDAFPTTVNGKLDKKALPAPQKVLSNEYIEPMGTEEKLVAKIFEQIFTVKKVGRTDNFFELGGDSIKAMRVVSKLRESGYEVSVKKIMEGAVVSEIASVIKRKDRCEVAQEETTGVVERTPIQQYFYECNLKEEHHFNQSVVFESKTSVDVAAFIKACHMIMINHDMLRMVVKDGKQIICSSKEAKMPDCVYFDFEKVDHPVREIEKKINESQGSIDLKNGPLMKLLIFQTKEMSYVAIIIHHLIIDGVSWRILAEDLNTAYRQALDGEEIRLPVKTSAYTQWSLCLKKYRHSEKMMGQIKYWKQVNNEVETGRFISGDKKPVCTSQTSIKIPETLTMALLHNTGHAYATDVKDLLLAALCRTVRGIYGNRNIAVNLEGHGREPISDEVFLDRTIGWFTTLYPVVFHVDALSGAQDIKDVKEQLRRIPENGIGYGILSVYDSVIERKEADITFNYLGEFEAQDETAGSFRVSNISSTADISYKNIFGSPVTVNCAVVAGQMEVDLIYHNPVVTEEEAELFISHFRNEIEDIILFCKAKKEQENTASDFGEYVWSDEELKKTAARIAQNGGKIARIIPMTPMQEGILYNCTMDKESTGYIIQCGYKVDGAFSKEAFIKSLDRLTEKHAALRTAIVSEHVSEPRQVVLKERKTECREICLNGSMEDYEAALKDDVKRGFHLETDPLLRVTLMYISKNDIRVVFCFHHIIIDGWCFAILMNELETIYASILAHEDKHEDWGMKNKDVYEKFARFLYQKDKGKALKYWAHILEDYEEQATIETLNKPEMGEEEVAAITAQLTVEESQALESLGRRLGITNSTLVEAAWGLVLQRYNNTDDVVFAKIVSGRNQDIEGIEQEVGLFINAVPVRVKSEQGETVEKFLKKLQTQGMESAEYDYAPLSDVQMQSALGADLIYSIFAYENYQTQNADAKQIFLPVDYREQTSYKLSVSAAYTDRLYLKLMYATQCYSQTDAQLVLKRFTEVLRAVISDPSTPVTELELMDDVERYQVLNEFNNNIQSYNGKTTILDLLSEQVKKNPDRIAVSCGEERLTYRQLDICANYLAKELMQHKNYKKGSIAGLICRRSLEMMVGIYGIMRAGMAYLPIIPELPGDRVAFMLEDSGAVMLIYTNELREHAYALKDKGDCIMVQRDTFREPAVQICLPKPSDPAYMIYTSGTTGKPKGVVVTHASLANLVYWEKKYFHMNESTRMLQQFSFIFDGSVFEIFAPAAVGAEVIIIPDEVKNDSESFMEYLPAAILIIVPSAFKVLLEYAKEQKKERYISEIKHVGTAGEALTNAVARMYFEMSGTRKNLHNLYGPTEATVCATVYKVRGNEYGSIPIGKPIGNMKAYILRGNKLCGIGMQGELCVGGIGVTAGYKNQKQLTAEKFVPNPYMTDELIYRTGDLAKWDFDGNIRYIGRTDEQVKIRGFRIETGEIQNRICDIPVIADAVVVAKTIKKEISLCAYIVVKSDCAIESIKTELKRNLPDYMIPSHFIVMEHLPYTRNGKVDKKALPEPPVELKQYKEPETDIEKQVADAFSEVLDVRPISREDNFLQLGGHSLKATRLANRLAAQFGIKVPLSIIMRAQTVEKIALHIEELKAESANIQREAADEQTDIEFAEEEVFN